MRAKESEGEEKQEGDGLGQKETGSNEVVRPLVCLLSLIT